MNGSFNIDCYGAALNQDTDTGHAPADKNAALQSHKALRLVRNILMASTNTYLQLRTVVGERMASSITSFQPEISNRNALAVVGSRLVLSVKYLEFSPQYEGPELELINVKANRAEDGQLLAEKDINFIWEGLFYG